MTTRVELPELVEQIMALHIASGQQRRLRPSEIAHAIMSDEAFLAAIEATETDQQLREEVERLREALEPFSKAADMADERMIGRYGEAALLDDTTLLGALNITLGHVRRARSSLSSSSLTK